MQAIQRETPWHMEKSLQLYASGWIFSMENTCSMHGLHCQKGLLIYQVYTVPGTSSTPYRAMWFTQTADLILEYLLSSVKKKAKLWLALLARKKQSWHPDYLRTQMPCSCRAGAGSTSSPPQSGCWARCRGSGDPGPRQQLQIHTDADRYRTWV